MTFCPEKIRISMKSSRLLKTILIENPRLEVILKQASDLDQVRIEMRNWAGEILAGNQAARDYYRGRVRGRQALEKLRWRDYAAIRVLDYLDYGGREYPNPFRKGQKALSDPFLYLWQAYKYNSGGTKSAFFLDFLYLFRQMNGSLAQAKPDLPTLKKWMKRWNHGLEPEIVKMRAENREKIMAVLVRIVEEREPGSTNFTFPPGLNAEKKLACIREWWDDYRFHLDFAVRSPELLNEMLGHSLDEDTLKTLSQAKKKGIPFFINPYYLSLLCAGSKDFAVASDLAIRHYVIYNKQLIENFGTIEAWEKEDRVEKGKPNAAGWVLPSRRSLHRRYPEVAIMIPDTMGRACGGLCVSCQRMYDFQRGNLGFNLDELRPDQNWQKKLRRLLDYYEKDSQLRDILITGGDALMSRDQTLADILENILEMVKRKRKANLGRKDGEKYAEIIRVRLGTRLPAYLPQRVTPGLVAVLGNFRSRAHDSGVRQFIIQTHFESPMEITAEVKKAVKMLHAAGWMVTNQTVFTCAASRRGHNAKLRRALNKIGVISYYTFTVKGFLENTFNYATNARSVQEQTEEKVFGVLPSIRDEEIRSLVEEPKMIREKVLELLKRASLPFLATDSNVINLPAVGKSMTFRTIGITRLGRRILEFDYDHTRAHSPIVAQTGKVVIIESKPIAEYLRQLRDMGEDSSEYETLWGYSVGESESRVSIFNYPAYPYRVTKEMTNLVLPRSTEKD